MSHRFNWAMVVLGLLFLYKNGDAQKSEPVTQHTDSLKLAMAKQKAANKERAAKTQFQYFVIKAANQTFGYDVYADGNLYLHQPTIPGLPGNTGFADTASAGRVARFVINKIKLGEIPPTITQQELKNLKVKLP